MCLQLAAESSDCDEAGRGCSRLVCVPMRASILEVATVVHPLDEEEFPYERLLRQSAADRNSFTPIRELRSGASAVGILSECLAQNTTSYLQGSAPCEKFIVVSIDLDVVALSIFFSAA